MMLFELGRRIVRRLAAVVGGVAFVRDCFAAGFAAGAADEDAAPTARVADRRRANGSATAREAN